LSEGEEVFLSGIADECAAGIEAQSQMHVELGWKHIDIRNVDATTIDTLDDASFERVVSTLAAHGIQASCLASDVGKLWLDGEQARPFEDDVESLKGLIARAKRLSCRFIRVMGYRTKDLPDARWRDEAVARLKQLSAMAEDEDVLLGLENCVGWHSQSGRRICEFLDRVGSEHLVCLYDTGNPPSHGVDPLDFYEAVRDRIRYIHLKDAAGEGWRFAFPGEGICEVRCILEDQYKRGYRGCVAIEPHMAPSAHLPNMKSDRGGPSDMYRTYGDKANLLLAEIMGHAK